MLFGVLLERAYDNKTGRKLDRINNQFDEDGWYNLKHKFDAQKLYEFIILKDSLTYDYFYQQEEFTFLDRNAMLRSELDTFDFSYQFFPSGRKDCNFSPTIDAVILEGTQKRNDWNDGKHCYLEIAPNEIACCLILRNKIVIPYVLFADSTILARPKPYVPSVELEQYKKSLVPIKGAIGGYHAISFGSRQFYTDTSKRFANFLSTYKLYELITTDIKAVDTAYYAINHMIQFHAEKAGNHVNYYRYFFTRFHTISEFSWNAFKTNPMNKHYFPPVEKIEYKKKLDAFFLALEKNHPELLIPRKRK